MVCFVSPSGNLLVVVGSLPIIALHQTYWLDDASNSINRKHQSPNVEFIRKLIQLIRHPWTMADKVTTQSVDESPDGYVIQTPA